MIFFHICTNFAFQLFNFAHKEIGIYRIKYMYKTLKRKKVQLEYREVNICFVCHPPLFF